MEIGVLNIPISLVLNDSNSSLFQIGIIYIMEAVVLNSCQDEDDPMFSKTPNPRLHGLRVS